MKTKIVAILAAAVIICFTTSELSAVEDKIFTSSGQILDGEVWNNVYIYNDDTIVDMLGGLVDQMQTYDYSMLNVTGGDIYSLYTWNYSVANISDGSIYGVSVWDYATANLSGDGNVISLGAGVLGIINMMGGTTEYLRAGDFSVVNMFGGTVNIYLNAWDSATVNIYGYGFDYDPSAGNWNGGQLTGFWLDDTPFIIDLAGSGTYSHINLVPEPGSLILFALGALLVRRKK